MTEATMVSQEEMNRRETYLRAYNRPRNLLDPYTWLYPYKTAALAIGGGGAVITFHNIIYKKPWYYSIVPRVAGLGFAACVAFGLGILRTKNCLTRDAVVEHYMELHPDDCEKSTDFYGRPYSSILLPWIPMRAQYHKFEN